MKFYKKSPYSGQSVRVVIKPQDIVVPKSMTRVEEVAMYNLEKYLKEKLYLTDEQIKEYLTYKLCQETKKHELDVKLIIGAFGINVLYSWYDFYYRELGLELLREPIISTCSTLTLAYGLICIYSSFKLISRRNYYTKKHCVIEGMEKTLPVAEDAYFEFFEATKKANKQYKLGLQK